MGNEFDEMFLYLADGPRLRETQISCETISKTGVVQIKLEMRNWQSDTISEGIFAILSKRDTLKPQHTVMGYDVYKKQRILFQAKIRHDTQTVKEHDGNLKYEGMAVTCEHPDAVQQNRLFFSAKTQPLELQNKEFYSGSTLNITLWPCSKPNNRGMTTISA